VSRTRCGVPAVAVGGCYATAAYGTEGYYDGTYYSAGVTSPSYSYGTYPYYYGAYPYNRSYPYYYGGYPYYRGYPYYGGYYNGFYNGLYNGFYDPYPYASAPYYPVAPYETSYAEQSYAPPSPSPGELQLSNQVERLTREVQQLRQDQSQAALQQALAPPLRIAEPPPIPITLVFRDGRRLTTQSYAISRQTLWVVGDRMSMRVDLKDLDLPATQQANLGRVLLLPVPTQ